MTVEVLDSWALMAWLGDEKPAVDSVQQFLDRADAGAILLYMSAINAGEIYYLLAKRRSKAAAEKWWEETLPALPIRLELPNLNEIREASRLKGRYPISYADAFAAGLAMKYSTRLTTGDPEFQTLERLRLNWIGAK
ncbi:MAG: type II toxin-antitoxin system VapC family toxin [Bryobacteraceae bacterium]